MRIPFALALIFLTINGLSQPGGGKGRGEEATGAFSGEIYGKVIDSVSSAPIEYATIALYNQKDNSLISGLITPANGSFSLPDLKKGIYQLKISFIGYRPKEFKDLEISDDQATINLKEVRMAPEMLDSVVVSGDVPLVSYEIDKKVINVDDQNTNLGQTAVEILANVPSITVDGDGNLSLRGSSSFTLFINGIPTAMDANDALRTIPAGSIENIEIITNPSARFDAEGTSGIINIITKKKKLEGVSLLTNINLGTYSNYGGDVSVSVGKDKLTFNLNANYNRRNRPRWTEEDRTSFYDSTISRIYSEGESSWDHLNAGGNAELTYEPNSSHTLVLAGSYTQMQMRPYNEQDFYEYSDGILIKRYRNLSENFIDLYGSSISLFYQYKIKRNAAHTLTFKAINNQKDVDQEDYTHFYDMNGEKTGGTMYTETGPADFNRFNIDYVRPFKNSKMELGSQVQLGYSSDDGKNFTYVDSTDSYAFNPLFSSFVEYTRDVYAGYGIFSGKLKKLEYQFGLRGEYTYRTIAAPNFSAFDPIKRMDWFPSAHFSYKKSNDSQFLLSYSRRIQRPRSWYFEPFITWESPYNVRSGNPNLKPEYINSFDFSWVKPVNKKGYLTIELYFRSTQGMIERIQTVYQDNILISRPYNIGVSSAMGAEPSLIYDIKENWKINAAANIFYFDVTGDIEGVEYSNTSFNYTSRVTNTFTYKKSWVFQVLVQYNSKTATPQGEQKGFVDVDASVRKSFAKNKYTFTLQGNNVLNTRVNKSTIITDNVELIQERRPLYPMVTMTFSMKLNNYKKVLDRHAEADDF